MAAKTANAGPRKGATLHERTPVGGIRRDRGDASPSPTRPASEPCYGQPAPDYAELANLAWVYEAKRTNGPSGLARAKSRIHP
jgi:hypothetical protein